MTSNYVSVSVATFQPELLPGPSLSARQLKKLGNFAKHKDALAVKEQELCSLLVSSSCDTHFKICH